MGLNFISSRGIETWTSINVSNQDDLGCHKSEACSLDFGRNHEMEVSNIAHKWRRGKCRCRPMKKSRFLFWSKKEKVKRRERRKGESQVALPQPCDQLRQAQRARQKKPRVTWHKEEGILVPCSDQSTATRSNESRRSSRSMKCLREGHQPSTPSSNPSSLSIRGASRARRKGGEIGEAVQQKRKKTPLKLL